MGDTPLTLGHGAEGGEVVAEAQGALFYVVGADAVEEFVGLGWAEDLGGSQPGGGLHGAGELVGTAEGLGGCGEAAVDEVYLSGEEVVVGGFEFCWAGERLRQD